MRLFAAIVGNNLNARFLSCCENAKNTVFVNRQDLLVGSGHGKVFHRYSRFFKTIGPFCALCHSSACGQSVQITAVHITCKHFHRLFVLDVVYCCYKVIIFLILMHDYERGDVKCIRGDGDCVTQCLRGVALEIRRLNQHLELIVVCVSLIARKSFGYCYRAVLYAHTALLIVDIQVCGSCNDIACRRVRVYDAPGHLLGRRCGNPFLTVPAFDVIVIGYAEL